MSYSLWLTMKEQLLLSLVFIRYFAGGVTAQPLLSDEMFKEVTDLHQKVMLLLANGQGPLDVYLDEQLDQLTADPHRFSPIEFDGRAMQLLEMKAMVRDPSITDAYRWVRTHLEEYRQQCRWDGPDYFDAKSLPAFRDFLFPPTGGVRRRGPMTRWDHLDSE